MPDKLGNTFKNTAMVSPLNADPGKADPGPPVLNNPLIKPADKDGFLSEPTKVGTKKGLK